MKDKGARQRTEFENLMKINVNADIRNIEEPLKGRSSQQECGREWVNEQIWEAYYAHLNSTIVFCKQVFCQSCNRDLVCSRRG